MLTCEQIAKVKRHLYDHAQRPQPYVVDDYHDHMWLTHGGTVPEWLDRVFEFWLMAWHDQDWATLAQWMPVSRRGQFASMQLRNFDLFKVMEWKCVYDDVV